MAIVAAVAVLVLATPACAQLLRPPTDPQSLQQPRKAPMTLTPSVTVSEEFNDNVFLDNTRKEWDLITRITPGVSFGVGEPTAWPPVISSRPICTPAIRSSTTSSTPTA